MNDYFFGDDFLFLRSAQTVPWHTWLAQAFDYRDPRPTAFFNQYRPLYVITFRAEYSLFGLNAMPYHLVNVAIHLANVSLLWLLARRLTGRVWAAHLTALVFGVHFAYGDAVRWVVNGNTPMAVFWYLVAFLLFIKYTDGGRARLWYYAAFLVALTAALLYHAVTVPLAAAIFAWYFLMHRSPRDLLRPSPWLPFVPLALVVLPFVAIQEWVHRHYLYLSVGFQTGWHMYDNYIEYLAISAYPVNLHNSTAPYVSAVMFVLCGFLLLQWRWSPLAAFAVIWYISALAPDSTLLFGAFGRLLYLPAMPLALLVSTVAMRLVDLASERPLKSLLAPLRGLLPYAGLTAVVLGVLLVLKLQDIGSKTGPTVDNTIGKQSAASEQFINDLRAQLPSIPAGGTLYVVSPPHNLIIFTDRPLESLVELYYGEAEVKSVPLKEPPFWDAAQVQAALRPQDRLFTFERRP